jgi:hypothetical protein
MDAERDHHERGRDATPITSGSASGLADVIHETGLTKN